MVCARRRIENESDTLLNHEEVCKCIYTDMWKRSIDAPTSSCEKHENYLLPLRWIAKLVPEEVKQLVHITTGLDCFTDSTYLRGDFYNCIRVTRTRQGAREKDVPIKEVGYSSIGIIHLVNIHHTTSISQ